MVKKISFLFILFSMVINIHAQTAVAGEYYLRGVMETASGFLLKPDSTFEFFFSYGALDRAGSGNWVMKGSKITFNSKPKPVHDFALINCKTVKDSFITIKITDNSTLLQRYVNAQLKFADTTIGGMTNENGEIKFPRREIENLSLQFKFCPEKISLFDLDKKQNYFEFRFEPWLMEYFFNHFHLTIDGRDLKGSHPLLKEGDYRYEKR